MEWEWCFLFGFSLMDWKNMHLLCIIPCSTDCISYKSQHVVSCTRIVYCTLVDTRIRWWTIIDVCTWCLLICWPCFWLYSFRILFYQLNHPHDNMNEIMKSQLTFFLLQRQLVEWLSMHSVPHKQESWLLFK